MYFARRKTGYSNKSNLADHINILFMKQLNYLSNSSRKVIMITMCVFLYLMCEHSSPIQGVPPLSSWFMGPYSGLSATRTPLAHLQSTQSSLSPLQCRVMPNIYLFLSLQVLFSMAIFVIFKFSQMISQSKIESTCTLIDHEGLLFHFPVQNANKIWEM